MATTLSSMKPPSVSLLRAFLRPQYSLHCRSQTRSASGWMPREKYAKVTALDKLHRKQKADQRNERLQSRVRAASMPPPPYAAKAPVNPSPEAPVPDDTDISASTSPPSPSSSPANSPNLPYTLARAGPSKNLPVYESTKGGGTKHITTVRKLSGDLEQMQAHLRDALGLEPYVVDRKGRKKENVEINWRTNHIIIRGWRGAEVKRWAEMVGF